MSSLFAKHDILFFIGQDVTSIDGYVSQTGLPVDGFTEYTSLRNLEGITAAIDYGSGPHHLDDLAARYPDQAIALGLHVVDYLPQIASGAADEQIDTLLAHLARYDRPVYLRFGYEVDGEWNRHTPPTFVEVWIHFHNKVKASGNDQIVMVWQTAAFCGGTYFDHPISAWYPGDEYVDWIGFSYFTQADCDFAPVQEVMAFARMHEKPIMIAESTPQRFDLSGMTYSSDGGTFVPKTAEDIWNEWYGPFFQFIEENRDVIRAVAYINARWDDQEMWGPPYTQGYWGDTRVEANPEILQLWRDVLKE